MNPNVDDFNAWEAELAAEGFQWMVVTSGGHCRGVFPTREAAEVLVRWELDDEWDTPCTMQCGRTDGVEVMRREAETVYVYGDGWVRKVVRVEKVR